MRTLRLGLVLVLVTACATTPVTPSIAQGLALVHARLYPGDGSPVIPDGVLVIEDGRIAAVGAGNKIRVPRGMPELDLNGRMVLPGLISDHSHVGLVKGLSVGAGNDTDENVLAALHSYACSGVTTVTALGLNAPRFTSLRELAHAGSNDGADLFGAIAGIGVPQGAPPEKMLPVAADQLYRPSTPDEARAAVREMAAQHTDLVKLWLDDFGGAVPVKMKPDIYRAVIDEAHRAGLRVAAHIHDLEDARALVNAGVDILAHGVRDHPVGPSFIDAVLQRGVFYIPTLALDESTYAFADNADWTQRPFVQARLPVPLKAQIADPAWHAKVAVDPKTEQARASLAVNLANVKALFDAGVKLGFGTDSGATPLRVPGVSEQRELELLVQAGLTPGEALTLATSGAAKLLQLTDRGELKAGARADLLVVEGNPLHAIADTSKIFGVWRGGKRLRCEPNP